MAQRRRCEWITERLHDWLRGTLPASQAEEVRRHLEACASCQKEERFLRNLLQTARSLPRLAPPPTLKTAIWARIAQAQRPQPTQRWAWLRPQGWARPVLRWGWAAGVALLLVMAWHFWERPRPRAALEESAPMVMEAAPAPQAVEPPAASTALPAMPKEEKAPGLAPPVRLRQRPSPPKATKTPPPPMGAKPSPPRLVLPPPPMEQARIALPPETTAVGEAPAPQAPPIAEPPKAPPQPLETLRETVEPQPLELQRPAAHEEEKARPSPAPREPEPKSRDFLSPRMALPMRRAQEGVPSGAAGMPGATFERRLEPEAIPELELALSRPLRPRVTSTLTLRMRSLVPLSGSLRVFVEEPGLGMEVVGRGRFRALEEQVLWEVMLLPEGSWRQEQLRLYPRRDGLHRLAIEWRPVGREEWMRLWTLLLPALEERGGTPGSYQAQGEPLQQALALWSQRTGLAIALWNHLNFPVQALWAAEAPLAALQQWGKAVGLRVEQRGFLVLIRPMGAVSTERSLAPP